MPVLDAVQTESRKIFRHSKSMWYIGMKINEVPDKNARCVFIETAEKILFKNMA